MGHDPELAERLRTLLAGEPDVGERRMFGGLAFLVAGSLAVGASGRGGLMLRCHPDDQGALLSEPHAGPMEMRGRPARGWLRVDALGVETPEQLEAWVVPAVHYARSLAAESG